MTLKSKTGWKVDCDHCENLKGTNRHIQMEHDSQPKKKLQNTGWTRVIQKYAFAVSFS